MAFKGAICSAREPFIPIGSCEVLGCKEILHALRGKMSILISSGLDARTCRTLAAHHFPKSFRAVHSTLVKRHTGMPCGLRTTPSLTTVKAPFGQFLLGPVHNRNEKLPIWLSVDLDTGLRDWFSSLRFCYIHVVCAGFRLKICHPDCRLIFTLICQPDLPPCGLFTCLLGSRLVGFTDMFWGRACTIMLSMTDIYKSNVLCDQGLHQLKPTQYLHQCYGLKTRESSDYRRGV